MIGFIGLVCQDWKYLGTKLRRENRKPERMKQKMKGLCKMADMSNPTSNNTFSVETDAGQRSPGVADCWHGIIEKRNPSETGEIYQPVRINVEVKSLTDLMSHYDQPRKSR